MDNEEKIKALKKIIDESDNICVFTGAGISVPSGIPDFRSANGLYNEKTKGSYSPEQIISHSFFMRNTEMFYDFYKNKMMYLDAKPNDAHKYFASLEKRGKKVPVVTQNIDGLHQAAGSSEVIEIHGSIHRNYCTACRKFFDSAYVKNSDGIPKCDKCSSIIKPDVVLYEEPLDEDAVGRAVTSIANAQTMIIIGTSLVVYPAASYVRYFRGEHLILLNKTSTQYDSSAELAIYDDVVNVVHGLEKLEV